MNSSETESDHAFSKKRKSALKRWHMLAQVLRGESCAEVVDNKVSVRRFQSFGLLTTKHIDLNRDHGGQWYMYTCQDLPGFSVQIRHLDGTLTFEQLNGFNNTGNVCVWPSEEVLTFYCLQHVQDFRAQRVCELGGGMTCLASVALAVYSEAAHVELTDGNEESVQNLQCIIDNNSFNTTFVSARLLRWGSEKMHADLQSSFDWVICADCLFFDDGRDYLAELIFDLLKEGGQALIFAPSRNETFYKFADIAQKLFHVSVSKEYNSEIQSIHCQMQIEHPDVYDESLHYPIMMKLTKPLSASRDVTPESR